MLTASDVSDLFNQPSTSTLTAVARKIASDYSSENPDETNLVTEDVIRTLLTKAALEVRVILAEVLKQTDSLPRDIAVQLALDVKMVACPFLEASPVLDEPTLLSVIHKTHDQDKYRAIASRQHVPDLVADELAVRGDAQTAAILVKNAGAMIPSDSLASLLIKHRGSEEIYTATALRDDLPPQLIDLIITAVSEPIRKQLQARITDNTDLSRMNSLLRRNLDLTAFRLAPNQASSPVAGRERF